MADKVRRSFYTDYLVVGVVILSLFLRLLWLETPVVRDEGAVGYVAMVWSHGLSPYSSPMASVNPPVAYLIYMASSQLFGNTIVAVRMINDALFAFSVFILYLIARDWYDERVGLVSAFFYGLFMNAPIFETHLAIPSSLSIPFVIISIYLFSNYLRNGRKSILMFSGLLMSIASLAIQYQAIGIVLLFVLLAYSKRGAHAEASKQPVGAGTFFGKNLVSSSCVLALGVSLPILATAIYFWSNGALAGLIQSTITPSWGPGYVSQPDVYFSLKFLIIVEALPIWLFSIAGLAFCFLRLKKYDVLLIAWTIFFLIIAIPPPHFGRHLSQLLPPMSLLSGVVVMSILKDIKLKSVRIGWRNREKSAMSIFFLTILVMSFVPAIYFQQTQFPNTNFSLFREDWYYSFSRNWNEQQELVDYIKSNANDGEVFIHGWEAELYWLSGRMAPSIRWVSSYKSSLLDITDKDYQEILNRVKSGDFDRVILVSSFPPDEIMRSVPQRYFFVESIGLYHVYSKYNAEGYSIGYNFVENLGRAYQKYSLEDGTQGDLKNLNESIYVPVTEEISVNGENRVAIKHIPIAPWDSHIVDSNLIYSNISIPSGSKLSFGISLHPDSWTKDTDGATFKILVADERGTHEIFHEYINPQENIEDRRWQDFLVDLSEFEGKKVSIYLVTNPGPNRSNAYDWAYWSQPLVLESPK